MDNQEEENFEFIIKQLTKIHSQCIELLSIAEKRTPGKWAQSNLGVDVVSWGYGHTVADCSLTEEPLFSADTLFIAKCAGAAEAGWRIVRDEINEILIILEWRERTNPMFEYGLTRAKSIINSFAVLDNLK